MLIDYLQYLIMFTYISTRRNLYIGINKYLTIISKKICIKNITTPSVHLTAFFVIYDIYI